MSDLVREGTHACLCMMAMCTMMELDCHFEWNGATHACFIASSLSLVSPDATRAYPQAHKRMDLIRFARDPDDNIKVLDTRATKPDNFAHIFGLGPFGQVSCDVNHFLFGKRS